MEILFSVLLGGGFGAVWALLEIAVFLRGLKRCERRVQEIQADEGAGLAIEKQRNNYIMKYFICKYVINVLLLLAVFCARSVLPYRWEIILLSAGIVLALVSQVFFARFGTRRKQS